MQVPTLQNVRIRSTRDAHQVFLGVARNVLPLITRRLDAEERRSIVPGNVYVWEERGNGSSEATTLGMERWTDGMGWGPSRVRDEFLFYHQKEPEVFEDPNNPSTPWAQMISMYPSPRSRSMSESERLIKQTYSVHVSLPADRPQGITRKWHITAYFSQKKLESLATIDTISGIGNIPVPEGLFRSGRTGKGRRQDSDPTRSAGSHIPPLISVQVGSSSRAPHSQDPPSFSAFRSSSPDAAIQYLYPTPGSYLPSTSQIMSTKAAAGPRPHSSHSTGVIGPSSARSQYRDQSPYHYPSSNSPSPTTRSRASSTSVNSSPTITSSRAGGASQLVPLEYLENVSTPRRDPLDEQLLRRFSAQTVTTSNVPRYGRSSQASTPSSSPVITSAPYPGRATNRHDVSWAR